MAFNFNGTTQYMETTSPLTAVPLTISCWVRGSSTSAPQGIFEINQGSQTNAWSIRRTSGSNNIQAYIRNSGTTITFNSSGTYTSGEWFHACLVCESNTSRTIYLNGGNEVTDTNSVTPTSINTVWVGFAGGYWNGDIAECAIWNSALNKDQVISLSKGFSASLVQSDNLVWYAPLLRNLQEISGARTITNYNTATAAPHPRIYGI